MVFRGDTHSPMFFSCARKIARVSRRGESSPREVTIVLAGTSPDSNANTTRLTRESERSLGNVLD